jgi:hypothetical protein
VAGGSTRRLNVIHAPIGMKLRHWERGRRGRGAEKGRLKS